MGPFISLCLDLSPQTSGLRIAVETVSTILAPIWIATTLNYGFVINFSAPFALVFLALILLTLSFKVMEPSHIKTYYQVSISILCIFHFLGFLSLCPVYSLWIAFQDSKRFITSFELRFFIIFNKGKNEFGLKLLVFPSETWILTFNSIKNNCRKL